MLCSCQPVSCGDVSLESSYEKVPSCVYTSTLLYEYEGFGLKAFNVQKPCLFWGLAYTEVCVFLRLLCLPLFHSLRYLEFVNASYLCGIRNYQMSSAEVSISLVE